MNSLTTVRNNLAQAYNRFDEFTCELARGCMGRDAEEMISQRERYVAIAIKCVCVVALVFGTLAIIAHPIVFGISVALGALFYPPGVLNKSKATLERNSKAVVALMALSCLFPFTSAFVLGLAAGQSLKPYLPHQVTKFSLPAPKADQEL